MISTPATVLPQDGASLARYLRATHLSALQSLYSAKLASFALEAEKVRRARKGRQKRRRGSPAPHDDAQDEEEEEEWERRKSLHFAGKASDAQIDKAHAYSLGYDLAPEGAADIYYHGNHPRPPAKVVYSLLNTTRYAPFFDPDQLTTAQLRSAVVPLFDNSPHPPPRPDQSPSDATKEWELNLIASFSTGCDERIGRSNRRNQKGGRPVTITRNSFPGSQEGGALSGGIVGGEGYSMRMAAPPTQHSHSHSHSHQNPQHPHHHQAAVGPHQHQPQQMPPPQQQSNGRNGAEYFPREPQAQPPHSYPPPPAPQQQQQQPRQYW